METINIIPSQYTNDSTVPNKVFSQYPECRVRYTSKVGIYGELYISDYVEENGYRVKIHLINEEGCDIQTEDNLIGIEVWNHSSPHSYKKRIESVIKNLEPFEYRFLIASFISKEAIREIEDAYIGNPIFVIKLGFHILPQEYLSFYQSKKDTEDKKFSYKQIVKILRNKLKPIIARIEKPEPIVNLMINDRGYVYTINNNDVSIDKNNNNGSSSSDLETNKNLNRVEIDRNTNKTPNKTKLHVHYDMKRICGGIKSTIKPMLTSIENLTIGDIWHRH